MSIILRIIITIILYIIINMDLISVPNPDIINSCNQYYNLILTKMPDKSFHILA